VGTRLPRTCLDRCPFRSGDRYRAHLGAANQSRHGEQTDGAKDNKTDTYSPASGRASQPSAVSDLKALVESEDSDAQQHHSLQNAQRSLHAISF
jgi:hypothetical protein